MGIDRQQYHSGKHTNSSSTRLLHLTIPSTSSFLYERNEMPWSNPIELDLLSMKKSPLMTTIPENHFLKVSPCIRRLYAAFNTICPNMYRIHCSDSLRTLREILCLIEEYLHIQPPSTVSHDELLRHEEYLHGFIHQLKLLPLQHLYLKKYGISSSKKTEIRCFGAGIRACDPNNELGQTKLFCFELTSSLDRQYLFPIDVLILDPNENMIPNSIRYINTYDQGYTKLFSCSYKPITHAGTYQISFLYNHIPLTNDPLDVFIQNSPQRQQQYNELSISEDRQEVPPYELEGDGYCKNVIVNSIARFRLRLNSLSKSLMDLFSLSIVDPFGHTIVVQRRVLSPDLLELIYQPMSIGEHRLSVLFNKQVHRQLLIHVINDEITSLSKLKPFGPGLRRAIVGLPTEFYVHLNEQPTNPSINHNHIQFCLEPSYQAEIDYEQQMATVRYTPFKEGQCPIHILEHSKDIVHSPFTAHVKQAATPHDKLHIQVTGLPQEIILHRPVEFQVYIDHPFDDPTHSLHVEILNEDTSPSVSIQRQTSSSYQCSFIPNTVGRYFISVDYAGVVAENNPFTSEAVQEKDIHLTGPAISDQCLTLNQPTHFSFKLKDVLKEPKPKETNSTYESGYSSNDDTSMHSTLPDGNIETLDNYRVTITDGHGNPKSNVSIKELNENVQVNFTPDEQILFINISCTW